MTGVMYVRLHRQLSFGKTTNMQEHPENKPIVWKVKVPHRDLQLTPISKICNTCRWDKFFEEFVKRKAAVSGIGAQCKDCKNFAKRKANVTAEKHAVSLAQQKARRQANPERTLAWNAKSRLKHRASVLAGKKRYREANREKCIAQVKAWHQANREYMRAYYKKYNETVRRLRSVKRCTVKRTKPVKSLAVHKRQRAKIRHIDSRIRSALRGRVSNFLHTGKHAASLLGCTIEHLKQWFEYNFACALQESKVKMNWENYGTVWEIDHVIPCAIHNMSIAVEVKRCFRWTNLAPITVHHNRSKGKRISENDIKRQYRRLMCFEAHLITLMDNIKIDQSLPGDE